jgi:hypothetical protein
MPEIIIVGSGAAGTAAALILADLGLRPLMLDVGYSAPADAPRVEGNLYDYRRDHDTFDLFIGPDLGGLADVLTGETGVAKLNAPNAAYVTRDAARLSPVDAAAFSPIQSFALGGLGNAWGAGLYRFVDADLDEFPLRAADLAPYFDRLTDEIGISGAADDLAPFFGDGRDLQPPLRLSQNAERFYRAYDRRRAAFQRGQVFVGRPRLGVLSEPKDGRAACDYSNTEFWQDAPYLYTPPVTSRKLAARGQLTYRPGVLVRSWTEGPDGVTVEGTDLETGNTVRFAGDALLLAAGAIGTSKIVLRSFGDYETRLPLLENPAVQIPFVLPASIGRALETRAFGLTQLNLVWESPAGRLQGSLLELTSPMRAEFFMRFPLSARANLGLVRAMLPAMLLMQLFFPGAAQPPAELSLRVDGTLRIRGHPNTLDLRQLRPLLGLLRSAGLWSSPRLIYRPATGHAIHYAGTLPCAGHRDGMSATPTAGCRGRSASTSPTRPAFPPCLPRTCPSA